MRKGLQNVVVVIGLVCYVFWLMTAPSSHVHLIAAAAWESKLAELATGILLIVAALLDKPRQFFSWFVLGTGSTVIVFALNALF